MSGPVIGIDLGTTNSCVATLEGGQAVVIPNSEGSRTTPSVVAFTKDGERLVGITAKRQAVTNSNRTILSVKREMGTDWSQKIDKDEYSPQEVSAFILQKLKADAEEYLGREVKQAVITCPAYFSDAQRQATKDAGRIAGLEVLRIINEPTAAALAYGVDKDDDQTILVYDLGGGTFDVSVLEIYQVDGQPQIEVKATSGDNRLGGDDFDHVVVDWLVSEFKKSTGIDLKKDLQAMSRLREAAEKAKIELSSSASTQVNLPFITQNKDGQPEHLDIPLSRSDFEKLISKLIERTMAPTRRAMKDSGVKRGDVDKVILVGGSTRVPAVQSAIEKEVGKAPFKGINPDEAVAVGATLQAGIIVGDEGVTDVLLLDVTPLSLGIETLGGITTSMIERNTTIPTRKSETFSTAADNQPAVEVHVLQGEREFAKDNITLGQFHLVGIPPSPRGVPQIEVTFDIDANGIVNVSAQDKATGKVHNITIQASGGLDESEIERMVKEAEENADADKEKREAIDTRNQAESMIHGAEKSLADLGDKADADAKNEVEQAITDLKTSLEGDDISAIKEKTSALSAIMMKMGEAAYKASEQNNAADSEEKEASSNENKEDVVDADFEEVKDNEEKKDAS